MTSAECCARAKAWVIEAPALRVAKKTTYIRLPFISDRVTAQVKRVARSLGENSLDQRQHAKEVASPVTAEPSAMSVWSLDEGTVIPATLG